MVGNITWLVPASIPGKRANPQVGSTSAVPPQAGSSQADSADSQAISTSQASKGVSTNSQGVATVPSPAGRSQADSTDSQAFNTSPKTIGMSPRQLVICRQAGSQQYFPGRQAGNG